jgi:hypothetical protein
MYNKIILSLYVIIGALLLSPFVKAQGKQENKKLIIENGYLLFLPQDYKNDSQKKWPMIMFLHGSGERGTVLDSVKKHGPPKIVEQRKDFPFIVVSPQCPPNEGWSVVTLNKLLDEVIAQNRVDTERIYLTGLSMGGFGTWEYAMAYPNRFAAIAPICGGGAPEKAWALRNMPIWVFHGAKDQTVPVKLSEDMVSALKKVGNDVKFTVYPEAGHDSWTDTYNNPELYAWFLKQKKKERVTIKVEPKILDAYVGQYELTPQFIISVSKESNRLFAQATGQPKIELHPESEKDYFIKEVDAYITFERDANGKVTQLVLHQNGDKPAKKIR